MWPPSLTGQDGKCRGAARLSVISTPPLDTCFGSEFVRVNIDAALQQEDFDREGVPHWRGAWIRSTCRALPSGGPWKRSALSTVSSGAPSRCSKVDADRRRKVVELAAGRELSDTGRRAHAGGGCPVHRALYHLRPEGGGTGFQRYAPDAQCARCPGRGHPHCRACHDSYLITVSVPLRFARSGADLPLSRRDGYDGDEPPRYDLSLLALPDGADGSCPSMRWKFGVELERPSVRRPEVELL